MEDTHRAREIEREGERERGRERGVRRGRRENGERGKVAKKTRREHPLLSPSALSLSLSPHLTLAAGCSTSSSLRMVAPSLVMVTSPMSSTSIFVWARGGECRSTSGAKKKKKRAPPPICSPPLFCSSPLLPCLAPPAPATISRCWLAPAPPSRSGCARPRPSSARPGRGTGRRTWPRKRGKKSVKSLSLLEQPGFSWRGRVLGCVEEGRQGLSCVRVRACVWVCSATETAKERMSERSQGAPLRDPAALSPLFFIHSCSGPRWRAPDLTPFLTLARSCEELHPLLLTSTASGRVGHAHQCRSLRPNLMLRLARRPLPVRPAHRWPRPPRPGLGRE